jgi:hypothetical protein
MTSLNFNNRRYYCRDGASYPLNELLLGHSSSHLTYVLALNYTDQDLTYLRHRELQQPFLRERELVTCIYQVSVQSCVSRI